MRIHFVARAMAANWPDLHNLEERDIATHAARFRGGINNWIVQTYLRVRAPLTSVGMTPSIGKEFVPGCVNVAHRDCLNHLFVPYFRSYVVGIRADRSPVHWCDIEIVQNELEPETPRRHFLNFWPQPGLIARDPARGCRVERAAYFGRASNAPAWYFDPAWHAALAAMGMVFEIRDDRWFDYSDVDVVLAHRNEAPTMLRQKPASKLTNAWHAGVPAVLADEPAYASLLRNNLDYISIDSPVETLAWLRYLRESPDHYAAIVDNGRKRSVEFSIPATRARWLHLLLDRAVPEARAWRTARRGVVATGLSHVTRAARQKLAAKHFKLKVLLESRNTLQIDRVMGSDRNERGPAISPARLSAAVLPRQWR